MSVCVLLKMVEHCNIFLGVLRSLLCHAQIDTYTADSMHTAQHALQARTNAMITFSHAAKAALTHLCVIRQSVSFRLEAAQINRLVGRRDPCVEDPGDDK